MISKIQRHFKESNGLLTITWLNHYSALMSLSDRIDYSKFDIVGIDGWFLSRILKSSVINTSADRILPKILEDFEGDIFLIGGSKENADLRIGVFERSYPKSKVVFNSHGFLLDQTFIEIQEHTVQAPTIFIIGLGASIQDSFALRIKTLLELRSRGYPILVATCGGWMDQILNPSYYPSFSFRLRINWLFRLIREPRRLWKRYSIEAIRALINRKALREFLSEIKWEL